MKSLFVTRTEELDARLDAAIDELHDIDHLTAPFGCEARPVPGRGGADR